MNGTSGGGQEQGQREPTKLDDARELLFMAANVLSPIGLDNIEVHTAEKANKAARKLYDRVNELLSEEFAD